MNINFDYICMETLQHIMRTDAENDIRAKSIFELSGEELRERLRATAIADMEAAWAKGEYITYYDRNICPNENYMIHEYRNRKELVFIDDNGNAAVMKKL